MVTVKIDIEGYLAEYARGKWAEPDTGVVHIPRAMDIYVLIYDLMQKRPVEHPVDRGNFELALPDRREGNVAGGKSPEQFNFISRTGAKIIERKLRVMFWAELHEYMDEEKHLHGVQYKESAFVFLRRYGIESISEDALLKNYQRWRDKQRRKTKRGYNRKKSSTF